MHETPISPTWGSWKQKIVMQDHQLFCSGLHEAPLERLDPLLVWHAKLLVAHAVTAKVVPLAERNNFCADGSGPADSTMPGSLHGGTTARRLRPATEHPL